MSNINSLKNLAEAALTRLSNGKTFVLGDVNTKVQDVRLDHPQDTVIQSFASVIERLSQKSPEKLVTQGELENIYQELVGLNVSGTKFREVLGDLLVSAAPTRDLTNTDYVDGLRDDPNKGMVEYDVDNQVKSGFEYLFQKGHDNYNPQNAANAKDMVSRELSSLGFDNRVRLAGGNSRFLVFAADLDTNRGAVRVFIPAVASGDQLPSIFVNGDRFESLSLPTLKTYLQDNASRSNRLPEVRAILNSLDIATGQAQRHMPQDDFAKVADSLPMQNGTENLSGPGVFTSMPDPNKDIGEVTIPQAPVPFELKALTSDIEENVLEASTNYPQATVRLAKRMLHAELSGMGFKGTQLRVAHPTSDGFICEATLNTPSGKCTIEIPVEMKNNIPLMPSIFAKNDFVAEFTTSNLHSIAKRDADASVTSVNRTSPLMGMSIHQLKDVIVRSAANNDLDTCDEVLEVIAERFDIETYRTVVSDYQRMVAKLGEARGSVSQAYDDSDQFVKTPNSIYPVHKKLGKPIHDLIKDENGEYHLKSTYFARQNQEEEGAFFSTAKVLVGD